MSNLIKRFVQEEDGMEFVEWALVATLFALVGIGAWTTLGGAITNALGQVQTSLETATP
jgi:Flp pilus assembly pilin Flp